MRYIIFAITLMISTMASAHEMVPTYPKLKISHIDGLLKTTMTMFNKRSDIEYYELGVFNKDFEPIPFVTSYKVMKIPYLSTVTFDVYIREQDKDNAVYICSRSKIRKEDAVRTAVSSRICSKIK
jgi:hypothetical protein